MTAHTTTRLDARRPAVRPRLFAIDVDHTLITEDHRVTPGTIAAVQRARAAGALVLLASSRPPEAMWQYLDALGLHEPCAFVACQGALIAGYTRDRHLEVRERHPAPLDATLEVVAAATASGIASCWYTGRDWFVSALDAGVAHEAEVTGLVPVPHDLHTLEHGPDKLLLIDADPRGAGVRAIAAALPSALAGAFSHPHYLEITAAGVDKSSAVRSYAAANGIDRAAVVAIGDGRNDLGMFAEAGFTVAPANAHRDVLAIADLVTASNDDDGVALALDALLAD